MWKYKCISENGDILLTTDSAEECNMAMRGEFGEPLPYAVIVLGDDGNEYVDFREF